jgi:prepilin signal peptidase PulO-like enzyme (type II secretory pathway)
MYFWVELVTGILVMLVVLKTGLCNQLAQIIPGRMLLIFFGVSCSMTDIRFRVVPDKLTYSGMVFALLAASALPEAWGTSGHLTGMAHALSAGLLAGWLLFVFAELGKIFTGKDVIGMGDVKFLALCGMLIGLPGTLFALLAGSWAGALWGVAVKRSFSAKLAFVPFIFLAALVWIFFDRQILDFYLKLIIQL